MGLHRSSRRDPSWAARHNRRYRVAPAPARRIGTTQRELSKILGEKFTGGGGAHHHRSGRGPGGLIGGMMGGLFGRR